MKVNMKTLILAFLLTTLATAIFRLQPEKASAISTVGVNVGDSAEYAFVTTGNSTFFSDFFNLTYVKLTVTAISLPTNITTEVLETFENGTQKTIVNFVDVDTGYGNGSGIFIGANLAQGDLIYPGDVSGDDWTGVTINETITKNYLGTDVAVNHYNRTMEFISPGANASTSLNYYWYQTSGMVTELLFHVSIRTTTSFEEVTIQGIITSIVPEFPTAVILPLFIAISTLAAVLVKRKIHRKPKPSL